MKNLESNEFSHYLNKIIKELCLFYEFESSKHFPTEFKTSLEMIQQKPEEELNKMVELEHPFVFNSKNHKKQSHRKNIMLDSTDIIKLKDNSYLFIPTNERYYKLYELIKNLGNQYNLSELFNSISWQDFESLISEALEQYGYNSFRTFRFKTGKKRHEIDIIARNKQKILLIDAKRWQPTTASSSALMKVAEEQVIRAQNLAKNPEAMGILLQRLNYPKKQKIGTISIYPIILVSSNIAKHMIVNGVPVLSFRWFNEFLNDFRALEGMLKPIKCTKIIFQRKLN